MRGYTHAVTGVAVSVLVSQKLGIRFDTVSAAVSVIASLLIYVSGHRGFTHSIVACGIMGLPLLGNVTVFVQFAAAYMTHFAWNVS